MINFIFMTLVITITFYRFFIKGVNDTEEEWKEVSPISVSMFFRFLYFGAINSFFANMIFDIEWMIWITIYSLLGMVICYKSKKSKRSTKIVLVIAIVIFFTSYRVPSHPNSFEEFVNNRFNTHCKYRIECVKISYHETDETIETIAEIMPVRDYSYKYYFVYSKGMIKLGEDADNQVIIKGLNIAGFWFAY